MHVNLLLVFSMIAEKHRYFAGLVDNCAWPDRVHMRQRLHVNAFTQFLGADHKGLLALILKVITWFTIGLMPPLLLLAIQLDFLAAQIESVTSWQQTAVLMDCLLAGYFWNNILQKERRARFPKDWNPPFWKRYLLEGWVLWISVVFIIGFSGLVALVPLSDYERRVHNRMPEWLGLAKSNCVLNQDIEKFRDKERIEQLRGRYSFELTTAETETLKIFTALNNNYNTQLVEASKEAREWTTPYRCSNWFTWWFIDRSGSWLNERLEIRRWLNLPDKVFVENRKTVQPQWLNRLRSELGNNTTDDTANKPSPDENTGKTTNADSTANFKTLDYFLPVNKENQHFHFARFSRSFLPNAKMERAQLQGADLGQAQLQGADLRNAQLQGAVLLNVSLVGVQFSYANLDHALILGPLFDYEEIDDRLIPMLKTYRSAPVGKHSKELLLAAIKRMENAKNKPLPQMSKATLDTHDHPCLLLTDNKELLANVQHVCDSASDLSINPLKHLRGWAKYNAQVSCEYKRFSKFTAKEFDHDNAYKIAKDYRTGSNDTTLRQASKALTKLAYFFYDKQLIQIHQDKSILCEARPELDAWYEESGLENNPELENRILKLKLEPFPTSAKP